MVGVLGHWSVRSRSSRVYTSECKLCGIARQLLPRAERHAQLLRAAATAFARRGFAATSMDEVAETAGVTKLIVYRHFAGKEELYRAVLDSVAVRIRDTFVTWPPGPGRTVGSLLAVAREDPDGFRLLLVHAAREPQFAEYGALIRKGAVAAADALVGDNFPDPQWRALADEVLTDLALSSVLHWLELGEPGRDEEFVERTTKALTLLVHNL